MVLNTALVIGPTCAILLFLHYGDVWELPVLRPVVLFGAFVAAVSAAIVVGTAVGLISLQVPLAHTPLLPVDWAPRPAVVKAELVFAVWDPGPEPGLSGRLPYVVEGGDALPGREGMAAALYAGREWRGSGYSGSFQVPSAPPSTPHRLATRIPATLGKPFELGLAWAAALDPQPAVEWSACPSPLLDSDDSEPIRFPTPMPLPSSPGSAIPAVVVVVGTPARGASLPPVHSPLLAAAAPRLWSEGPPPSSFRFRGAPPELAAVPRRGGDADSVSESEWPGRYWVPC